ncbi:hypothetical protein BUALT_Bualt11G0102400 [Buddleja alternifolia]|uniref:Uncharacterized protein n=1 Tax=Buddleja alternifolia TaxID=168488 RepID=A0AAV6X1Z2_9LAMI|nr:hypothetical protein BUALT_Bualt11G0102400 [Buddleja alternifolia]
MVSGTSSNVMRRRSESGTKIVLGPDWLSNSSSGSSESGNMRIRNGGTIGGRINDIGGTIEYSEQEKTPSVLTYHFQVVTGKNVASEVKSWPLMFESNGRYGIHTVGGMVGETVTETWFINIWKSSRKSISWEPERPVLGILSFEISRLMSKVVNLWQCLSDKQISRLREEVANSVGIQRLVSQYNDYLMDLAFAEIIGNLGSVANSVVMLGKKCTDVKYHNLENVFDDMDRIDPKWHKWQYKLKRMEKKVKKMERFVGATEQLFQELEVLVELEQGLVRVRGGADSGQVKLLEFQKKVAWQRQEVKNLREMSPWIRSYDYMVILLLRSLFTIIERIKYVYGINQIGNHEGCLIRSNSISALMQTPVYSSGINPLKFRSFSNLGLGGYKSKSKTRKSHYRSESSTFCGKEHTVKARRFAHAGFTGCMTGNSESPVVESYTPSCSGSFRPKVYFLNSKLRLLDAPPFTLGYAALALHYANIIILVEKLASSPHLISIDARYDLYNMLPATIRSCLRAKLKTFSRTLASSVYDDAFSAEWSLAIANILEWLSPLAHNMVRWQSERNFETRSLVLGSNVLLVQTLYFANQMETEAVIVELLMGLNYLSRFGREIDKKPLRELSCKRAYGRIADVMLVG